MSFMKETFRRLKTSAQKKTATIPTKTKGYAREFLLDMRTIQERFDDFEEDYLEEILESGDDESYDRAIKKMDRIRELIDRQDAEALKKLFY